MYAEMQKPDFEENDDEDKLIFKEDEEWPMN